jgi:Leucine-rich repeat (LRR) protein
MIPDSIGLGLSGPCYLIPKKLFKMKVVLESNQLSGPIPSSLGRLTDLFELSLGDNQLTGPIPSSLSNLTNLMVLGLENNQLEGIPKAKIT